MSELKVGTLCIIVAGCPANIGLLVEVASRIGPTLSHADAYRIRTVTGKNFAQVWAKDKSLVRGISHDCITDRHKLRPLVEKGSLHRVEHDEVENNFAPNRKVEA